MAAKLHRKRSATHGYSHQKIFDEANVIDLVSDSGYATNSTYESDTATSSSGGASTFEDAEDEDLLCIMCRQHGHTANQCAERLPHRETEWFYSERRDEMTILENADDAQQLCQECEDLNLTTWLHGDPPFMSDRELDCMDDEQLAVNSISKPLGFVGSRIFRKSCPLCLCLFGIIPTADSCDQHVELFRTWTMYRMEASISMDTAEKQNSTKCVTAVLSPSRTGFDLSELTSTCGDALCIAGSVKQSEASSLHARDVNPNQVNYNMIQDWLKTCEAKHPITCTSKALKELSTIRLVDVVFRKIVRYSQATQEYLALSHVWGGVEQHIPGAGMIGTVLPHRLPRTIEDSLDFVKRLSKRYLWIDSVCIRQDEEDQRDKLQQISIMSAIYQGAYATIIAMSGDSANSGLPRVNGTPTNYRQLQCTVNGTRLLGLGPSLSHLAWVMPWASRAWTYQEATLSPRCIYVSKYQVLFECNSMTCYESIDVSTSCVHQAVHDKRFFEKEGLVQQINTGVLRSPVAANITVDNNELRLYSLCATLYNYRYLTKQSDAGHAFDGILQALSRRGYSRGFFWALPFDDFNWALCSQGRNHWNRRQAPNGRADFPSWSWLSWGGAIWPGQPHEDGIQKPHQYPIDLRISKISEKRLETVFETSYNQMDVDAQNELSNDPLANVTLSKLKSITSVKVHIPTNAIALQGTYFQFSLADLTREVARSEYRFLCRDFAGLEVAFRVIETSKLLNRSFRSQEHKLILLARKVKQERVYHYAILLQPLDDGTYRRSCVILFALPIGCLSVLREMGMHHDTIILA